MSIINFIVKHKKLVIFICAVIGIGLLTLLILLIKRSKNAASSTANPNTTQSAASPILTAKLIQQLPTTGVININTPLIGGGNLTADQFNAIQGKCDGMSSVGYASGDSIAALLETKCARVAGAVLN